MRTYKTRGALNEIMRLQDGNAKAFGGVHIALQRLAQFSPSMRSAFTDALEDVAFLTARSLRIIRNLQQGYGEAAVSQSKSQIASLLKLGGFFARLSYTEPMQKPYPRKEMERLRNWVAIMTQRQAMITAMLERVRR